MKVTPKIDADLKADIVKWAAYYEHRIHQGSVSSLLSSVIGKRLTSKTEGDFPPGGVCRKIHAYLRKVQKASRLILHIATTNQLHS